MSGAPLGIDQLRAALLAAGDHLAAARDELCELDAVAGDGDLGVTLAAGFRHVDAALRVAPADDAGQLFRETGLQLARNAPSTIGALLASAFLRIGGELTGVGELDGARVAALLQTAATSVAERGGAEPGQRTVLDAMAAASAAARTAADAGAGPADVLRRAADGAAEGAAATAAMEPVHGRAGWIAERARGREDAGARAWAVFVDGLAAGVTPLADPQV